MSRIKETRNLQQLAITGCTSDLVANVDIDGFIISLNSAGYSLLGIEEGTELNKVRLVNFYAPDSATAFVKDGIPNAIIYGAHHSEVILEPRSGDSFPGSQVLIAHGDDLGNIRNFSVILRDIRTIKEAEKERQDLIDQLHQSKKIETVGRLAGGIAHDFNNYLTVIMGHAELGLLLQNLDDQAREEFDMILECAKKAARLSNQLLDFSSKQMIKPKPLNVNDILFDSEKLIKSVMGEDVEVEIDAEDNLWSIFFDRSQLDQAILNLALNARDAMSYRGRFGLETRNIVLPKDEAQALGIDEEGDYIKLSISDDGCGISAEHIPQVFDPFFTTKGKGQGTGLGLSAIYGSMKQNKSHIRVNSTEGKGTTFELFFPRDKSSSSTDEAEGDDSTSLEKIQGKEVILLVEDDESVRSLLSTVLKNLGYSVLEAADGKQAVDLYSLEKDNIDLIVSDVIMPKMNGMELYRKLRDFDKPFKILMMSGHTDQVLCLKELSEGNVKLMNKPFPMQDFIETVRSTIAD